MGWVLLIQPTNNLSYAWNELSVCLCGLILVERIGVCCGKVQVQVLM